MTKPRLVIFFLLTAAAAAAAANTDTITTATPLSDTDLLITADQTFALGFFTPPNSRNRYLGLWYYLIHEPTPSILWVANRNNPVVNSTATLSLLPSGNLIIANSSNITVWSSNSTATTSPIAKLLPTGNLVVLTSSSSSPTYAWQGYSYLTDTLIPNMHLGLDFADNINRTLVSWTSPSDPSPGIYNAYMDPRGDPEIFFNSPTSRIWRTGPWDGTHLSGIPDMVTYRGFNFSFADNQNEVSYFYTISNRTLVSRLIVNSTGVVQRAIWVWENRAWNYFWTAPKDQCDNIGYCGRFGVCDINNAPVCGCMQGFTPRNPANWNMYKYWREGCVRKTELDCVNGTDGFVVVSNVKLPQSGNCSVDRSVGLGECRSLCLKNCSCTAYASADVSGGGSGCVIWVGELYDVRNYVGAGQDLYVRLANADLGTPPGKSAHSPATVAIVVSVVVGVLLLACVGCFMWRRKKSRRVNLGAPSFNDQSTHEGTVEGDLDLPLFDLGTISAATDNFSVVNKLGEGGFGPVYKGMLGEGQEIAVKRLAKTSTQGIDEFKNEVMLIAKLQHRNLVRLVGCCIQRDERMLIYEYMSNTSLDAFLFEEGRGALLDWKTRHQIILGIARGLLYLHQDSIVRIIHRDLKVSNILLDKDMNPKISDFGMARIFGGDESDFNTRKVVGTYGYMSPEYAMDGVFSVKSDVFSFGVLVLEIISGKKNRGVYAVAPHTNLVAHAWSLWKEGKSLQLVDESMNYSFPMDEVLRCIKIGLLCVQEQPEDRPLMSTVLLMLGSDISSLPQPKQPGFAARRGPLEAYTSSSYQDSSTLNSISGTMVEGR